MIQDLYGDIDPTIKLEDILKPLKDEKVKNPDKQAEIGKKNQNGDVEMQNTEKIIAEAP